jgi:3-hydroxybutyryl-CoA dehydratase
MGLDLGLPLSELREGLPLPDVVRNVTQEKINLYASASGDFNPIHIDEAFARKTPLGGTVAHGMLILAYLSQMMTAAFGQSWLTAGKLIVRFRAPARPGDTLTFNGSVSRLEKDGNRTTVTCGVVCLNRKGEQILTGETSVEVKSDEDIS